MRNLDNDYRSWREDRYKKFSEEFSKWRSGRSAGGASSGAAQGTSETGSGSSNKPK